MVYEIYTWDNDNCEWNYWDTHSDVERLAVACNELGLRKQRVKVEVKENE